MSLAEERVSRQATKNEKNGESEEREVRVQRKKQVCKGGVEGTR